MSVAIYELTLGITTHQWLCEPCKAERIANNWTVKIGLPLPPGYRCADCELKRQAATGYRTPDVDYVPTVARERAA